MTAWARPLRTGPRSKHVGGNALKRAAEFEGVGQALIEGIVFDAGGQPLAGSFQDYAMRRAEDFPALVSPLRNESGGGIVLSYKTERGCRPVLLIPPASPKPLQGSPRAELSGPVRSPARGSTPKKKPATMT